MPELLRQAMRPDPAPANHLDAAIDPIRAELAQVNELISQRLDSDIALINTLANYLIHSGGKRLRPAILLLGAGAGGYRGAHHILLAAVIEFIHTATLLHDDVVDASATRRGKPTANVQWGNEASVLVGDFLYSRAFEMMVETGNMRILEILAATTNAIAEGEVLQLLNAHSPETTEQQYFETIRRKTAKLFAAAAELGGVIADNEAATCRALATYGMHLGLAFQLIDDILDYAGDAAAIGKDIGDDLAEGRPTLPLIQALGVATKAEQQTIRQAIRQGDRSQIQPILEIVHRTKALIYVRTRACAEARKATQALQGLPHSEFSTSLAHLAEFAVERGH